MCLNGNKQLRSTIETPYRETEKIRFRILSYILKIFFYLPVQVDHYWLQSRQLPLNLQFYTPGIQ